MTRSRLRIFLLVAMALGAMASPTAARTLSLEDRVRAQAAIEEVYWRHRIWPNENATPKPPLSDLMPPAALRAKVAAYLDESAVLDVVRRHPITSRDLQAEMDRMARDTRAPGTLEELFAALGNDPSVIAETLARQTLVARYRGRQGGVPIENPRTGDATPAMNEPPGRGSLTASPAGSAYVLPVIAPPACTNDTWTSTRIEIPDPRRFHTAVWTGTEMIVWGGQNARGFGENTGGRYDPATDTWTATAVDANTPEPRDTHTAVWTGTEMIVWGGWNVTDGFRYLNSGGRYDPVTDSWRPTSTDAGVPSGRTDHVAVWTGSRMVVWGGTGSASPYVYNTGARYDPATDTWAPTSTGPNVPTARYWFTAVWTGREMIVWGGAPGGYLNTGARYDPVADTWTPTSTGVNVPVGRLYHSAVWTGREMIVWGGFRDDGGQIPNWNLQSGGRYDPVSDSWTPTSVGAGVPDARWQHTAVWTGREMIVWGGTNPHNDSLSTGGRYDPDSDSWTATSTEGGALPGRQDHTAVWDGSEMIVWGGTSDYLFVDAGERYDPAADRWTPTALAATVPRARGLHSAVWTGAEMIVWGGGYSSVPSYLMNTGGRYDPATDSWSPTSVGDGVPLARSSHAAVWTGTEMIVWGGNEYDRGLRTLSSGGRYDPARDRWTPTPLTPDTPSPRWSPLAVWTGREMLIWGGASDTAGLPVSTGGRYDPKAGTWRAISTGANAPTARTGATAVWTGQEMIIWGGSAGGTYVNTGARYDPSADAWRPTAIGGSVPVPRNGHQAIWTGREMIVWGGQNGGSQYLRTGGRYNPAADSWASTSTGANTPPPLWNAQTVWTGQEMLVWGASGTETPLSSGGGRYDPARDAWSPLSRTRQPMRRFWESTVWSGTEMIIWGGADTASGGRYCACPNGRLVYRDADGDGFGNPGLVEARCDGSIPPGFADQAGDCDDANAAIHPGALEVCNGIDDDCNGIVDDGGATLCNDGDTCTTDSCDPTRGCIHLFDDMTPPAITCPSPVMAECEGNLQTHVSSLFATATDVCSPGGLAIANTHSPDGADASGLYPLGTTAVTFTATDGSGNTSSCETSVSVRDTVPPFGVATFPAENQCFGPAAIPVMITDNFHDVCDPTILRTYSPPPGPAYSTHGDHHVVVTAMDTSGNSASAGVDFTIDTVPPVVQLLSPPQGELVLPRGIPFNILFTDGDDDGAAGGVVHEVVKLQGCPIYDGATYGNGDGLLSDETLQLDVAELCRIAAQSGFTEMVNPELRVEATDCGGNVGFASRTLTGSIRLIGGVCGKSTPAPTRRVSAGSRGVAPKPATKDSLAPR